MSAPFRLDGLHALVTGASRGIGAAIATGFAEAGAARVTLVGRTESALDGTASRVAQLGAAADVQVCDVTDAAGFQAAFASLGRLDILVHAAGDNVPQPLQDIDLDVADRLWAVNVRAGLHAAREAVARMPARGGSVLFISSQMGHVGAPARSVYCATKHAVEGLTKALAVELAPRRVRVVSIAPTFIHTDLTAPFLSARIFREDVLRRIPLGRLARVEDVAAAAVFSLARRRELDRHEHPPRRRLDGAVSDTVHLTTGQALVRWLQAQWSERDGQRQRAVPAIFGIFGHGNALGLGQALAQEGSELPLYQPKNEQAMVHTAIGFAKAARGLQTLACTASIGPGATNMLTGAATATVNRLPALLLPADTFASRRSGVVLQQLEHPLAGDTSVNDAFRPLSRFFDRIARPEQLLTALPAAMRVLLDPAEAGAVTLALHQDVLAEDGAFPRRFFDPRVWTVARRPPAPEQIAVAARMLSEAERPLLIAGGGVRYSAAEAELAAFAERRGIPVAETSAGKGTMASGPLLLGGIGVNGTGAANRIAERTDLVICVGTRLTDFTTASRSLFQHPDVRFVGINVNAADAAKLSAAPVVADARLALEALTPRTRRAPSAYREEIEAAVERWTANLAADDVRSAGPDGLAQGQVYATINAAAGPGDWVVAAAGWAPGDLLKLWRVPEGGHAHIEFGYSCMGHEIPAALGIRMHHGADGEIFVVIGDGTYLMGPTELVTAAQEGWKLIVVVLDNAGYGSIDALATSRTGVSVGNRFVRRDGSRVVVDIAASAESFGCRGCRVTDADELARALDEARAADATTVIHCPTVPDRPLLDAGAFWDLGVPHTAADRRVLRLGEEHAAVRAARQRAL